MEIVLLVIQLFVALAIITVILIQPPESSSLGGIGGSNPMAGLGGTRAQGSILTRLTAILATIFIILSLVLAILAGNQKPASSILDATDSAVAPTSTDANTLPPQTQKDPVPVPAKDALSQEKAPDVPLAK